MRTEARFEGDVMVRSVRWLGAIGWMLAVLWGSGWMMSRAALGQPMFLAYGLFALVFGMGYGVKLFSRNKEERAAKAIVDARGVTIDGELALAAEEIEPGAYLYPLEHGRTSIHLRTHHPFRSLDLGLARDADGEKILEALGQDPTRAKARFRLVGGFENKTLRQIATFTIGLSTSCVGFVNGRGEVFQLMFAVWALALFFIGIAYLLPTYVTVGADGLFIERRARKRFVPFSGIDQVDYDAEHAEALIVRLTNEESIELHTSIRESAKARGTDFGQRNALKKRIDVALARFRERSRTDDPSFYLRREGRTAKAWIEGLAQLRIARSYRETHVTDEQLWQVLEDPTASPEDRAAALVALRSAADDAGKARQRLALEASAEPRLRVVLAAAENEDGDALEAALDELGEHDGRSEKA